MASAPREGRALDGFGRPFRAAGLAADLERKVKGQYLVDYERQPDE